MSKIAQLHAQETAIEVEFPDIDGFVISLNVPIVVVMGYIKDELVQVFDHS